MCAERGGESGSRRATSTAGGQSKPSAATALAFLAHFSVNKRADAAPAAAPLAAFSSAARGQNAHANVDEFWTRTAVAVDKKTKPHSFEIIKVNRIHYSQFNNL